MRIGKVEFDLSPMLTLAYDDIDDEIDDIEGECHANFNTSTNNTSHYHHKFELMNDQMQLLQTALISLGIFRIILIGGFVLHRRCS